MARTVVAFPERSADGTNVVEIKGSTLAEQKTEADESGGDLTFSANVGFVEIVNLDPVNDGVFTVNGTAVEVPASASWGIFQVDGTPSATVSVTGSDEYIVNRYS